MSMNWKDPETKSKLLMAILSSEDDSVLSSTKAPKIAEYMGCTAKAVTHQLGALRKELADFKAKNGQAAATPATTPAKKRKAKGSDTEDSGSPTKKTKAPPKRKATKAKAKKVEEPEVKSDDEADDAEIADSKDAAEEKEAEEDGENGDVKSEQSD